MFQDPHFNPDAVYTTDEQFNAQVGRIPERRLGTLPTE